MARMQIDFSNFDHILNVQKNCEHEFIHLNQPLEVGKSMFGDITWISNLVCKFCTLTLYWDSEIRSWLSVEIYGKE